MEEQREKIKTFFPNIVELTEDMKKIPIEDLRISIKDITTLHTMGIDTLGQLLVADTDILYFATTNPRDRRRHRWFGYWGIRNEIMKMGLFFNDDHLKWEQAGISDEVAMIKIEDLELSNYVKNRLIDGCFSCFGDLLTTDYDDIIHNSKLGKIGLTELKEYIHSLGFSLQNEYLTMEEIKESYKIKGIPLVKEELNLSSMTSGILYKNGIFTLEDLINFGSKVYQLSGMGDRKKQSLEEALQKRQIQLKPSDVPQTTVLFPVTSTETSTKEEKKSIKKEIIHIKELLSEYGNLIEEKNRLTKREQELNQKIKDAIATLSASQMEEGSNYVRKKG